MTLVDQGGDANPLNDINVSPLAFDDSYNAVGNTTLTVSGGQRRARRRRRATSTRPSRADTEFLGQTIGSRRQRHQGGDRHLRDHRRAASVTIAADGSFT